MIKTQQDCIETYLEDCIIETLDDVAEDQARKEIKDIANKINDIAYEVEKV